MSLVRYRDNSPSLFKLFFDDAMTKDSFFENHPMNRNRKFTPSANIKELEKEFIIELAIPGFSKEDFHIEVKENMLRVFSEKENKASQKTEKYSRREFHYSSFERTFTLPDNIQESTITADYKNGILNISLPKMEEKELEPVRKIKIG